MLRRDNKSHRIPANHNCSSDLQVRHDISSENSLFIADDILDNFLLLGYYGIEDIGYDIDKNQGKAFSYFTNGVACSVVEIDCLTGDHRVLKTDIVMDVGKSINPAIDVGQIEGAFVQGYGLFVLEQMVHSPSGVPFTRGPGAYKIPSFDDIPTEFNVTLLKGM